MLDVSAHSGSEDFADMLRVAPGADCRVGHTGTTGPQYTAFVPGEELLIRALSLGVLSLSAVRVYQQLRPCAAH